MTTSDLRFTLGNERTGGGSSGGADRQDDGVFVESLVQIVHFTILRPALEEYRDFIGGSEEENEEDQPDRREQDGVQKPCARGYWDDVAIPDGGQRSSRATTASVTRRDRLGRVSARFPPCPLPCPKPPRHLSAEEIVQRYRRCADGVEKTHWQIIWLLDQGQHIPAVAAQLGYSEDWVRTIVHRYVDEEPTDCRIGGIPIPGPSHWSARRSVGR